MNPCAYYGNKKKCYLKKNPFATLKFFFAGKNTSTQTFFLVLFITIFCVMTVKLPKSTLENSFYLNY